MTPETVAASEKPLWIEVVTDTYVPDINGVALSLGRLCAGLRELGHRVELIRSGRVAGESDEWVPWWPLPGYWEIKGKYAALKDATIICIVYRIGDTVVFAEIDDEDLSPNFIDPLVTKYGFDNVKWFVLPTKK